MKRANLVKDAFPTHVHFARLTGHEVGTMHSDITRLDEPNLDTGAAPYDTWTIGARIDEQLAGLASVSRQQPPGPPMRGFYRIHQVAVRAADRGHGYATGLIERCIRYAAANEGRTLWSRVPLDTVDLWRRCGFAIAGPPAATKSTTGSKSVWVLMTRRVAPADADLG